MKPRYREDADKAVKAVVKAFQWSDEFREFADKLVKENVRITNRAYALTANRDKQARYHKRYFKPRKLMVESKEFQSFILRYMP
jgi:3-methyladenine DNA glycosylase AlkD